MYLQRLAHGGQDMLQQGMILLLSTKLRLVCQADGFLEDVGLDIQFFGHGLDGVSEPTVECFHFVHDLHAFVDELGEFGFLFGGKSACVHGISYYKSCNYTTYIQRNQIVSGRFG